MFLLTSVGAPIFMSCCSLLFRSSSRDRRPAPPKIFLMLDNAEDIFMLNCDQCFLCVKMSFYNVFICSENYAFINVFTKTVLYNNCKKMSASFYLINCWIDMFHITEMITMTRNNKAFLKHRDKKTGYFSSALCFKRNNTSRLRVIGLSFFLKPAGTSSYVWSHPNVKRPKDKKSQTQTDYKTLPTHTRRLSFTGFRYVGRLEWFNTSTVFPPAFSSMHQME
jgi:hypothetical protein